jgi:hypothetical protein
LDRLAAFAAQSSRQTKVGTARCAVRTPQRGVPATRYNRLPAGPAGVPKR